ncbi:unnamed protein product [Strongylus vulgaris]|uniref:SF4 helicase domain-containing protein n=1 Tax=Strongylus vulgaris TaxID=40348 RepID=A0A3P7J4G0_STRVU|nr:unnamed protein product [Strongylus vulgaris]
MMPPAPPDPHIKYLWNESVDISEMAGIEQNEVLQLRIMLGIEVCHMDGYDQPAILYPRYRGLASRIRIPAGLKVIRKVGDRMEKENYPITDDPSQKSRFFGMFGYHMTTVSDRAVILTTNERDALAMYEATDGALAYALPHGERIDPSVFPYLEDFEQIFLWFPPRHLDYAKEWGYALNGARCYLIRNAERPIELVRNGKFKEVKHILGRESVRLREKGFRSMTDIREELKADLINSSTRQLGLAQWKRFAPLNKYLLGLRPGELTVLTGGTGFGKTTFLCEYALDLFTQGVRTLFCSFEMPEEKILKWMLVQYAGPSHLRSLARTLTYKNGIKVPLYRVEYSSAIDTWLDKFERTKGPLTIMKTTEFREKSINQIAAAIRSQVINSGCQHVVIDNLQFLVNQSTMSDEQSSSMERFHMQTDTDLDIQHFGGSARVTQEADNVLAIQRRRDDRDRSKFRKFLYGERGGTSDEPQRDCNATAARPQLVELAILKNRYGGHKVETDQLEMLFQPGTYSHTIVDHSLKL